MWIKLSGRGTCWRGRFSCLCMYRKFCRFHFSWHDEISRNYYIHRTSWIWSVHMLFNMKLEYVFSKQPNFWRVLCESQRDILFPVTHPVFQYQFIMSVFEIFSKKCGCFKIVLKASAHTCVYKAFRFAFMFSTLIKASHLRLTLLYLLLRPWYRIINKYFLKYAARSPLYRLLTNLENGFITLFLSGFIGTLLCNAFDCFPT